METNETKTETTTEKAEARKRGPHRTEAQRIADLQAEIAEIQARADEKALVESMKDNEEGAALVGAIHAIDRAIRIANSLGNEALLKAANEARVPLCVQASDQFDVEIPAPRLKVGGRPKTAKTEAESAA